jgi:hypothetical protein
MLCLWRHRPCQGPAAGQARAACLSPQMREVRRQRADRQGCQERGRRRARLLTAQIGHRSARMRDRMTNAAISFPLAPSQR